MRNLNRSINQLVILIVALLLCGGCQAQVQRDTQEPDLDKEQIIEVYNNNKDILCEIVEYAERTEGNLFASITKSGQSRFQNTLPDGRENIEDKAVLADIKSLHKKYGLYTVYEFSGDVNFMFAANDEKGVLYTNVQKIIADGYLELEQIDGNWYYYEIAIP